LGVNSLLTYKSLLHAKARGLRVFDFNGANSPNRADDKHAFGASAVFYADLEMS